MTTAPPISTEKKYAKQRLLCREMQVSDAATFGSSVSDPVARLQAIPRSTTAALEAIGNAINTANKFANKAVINTTAGTIVTAADATAGGVWQALDGTTAHTPV